jgi:hypothetical protein
MMFVYADPPYLGCGAKLYAQHHPDAADYDDPETHRALVLRLVGGGFDGWALSLHSPSLRVILPMCPDDCRVMAWVKPFASFKPNVNPAYCWEPVIVWGGRKRTREQPTVRDYVSASITLRKGLAGAKPRAFAFWLFEVLGMEPDDELVDLFPGTGAITNAFLEWSGQTALALTTTSDPGPSTGGTP